MRNLIILVLLTTLLASCEEKPVEPQSTMLLSNLTAYVDAGKGRIIVEGQGMVFVIKSSQFSDSLIYAWNDASAEFQFVDYKPSK